MPEDPDPSAAKAMLRASADRLARLKALQLPKPNANPSVKDLQSALQELSVHQIELEIQNEELVAARVALEESRARYFELYDLAPVGYLTIGENGMVAEANLTLANLLGLARSQIVGERFSHFILAEDQDVFYRSRQQLLELGKSQVCELRMAKLGTDAFWVRMEASLARDAAGNSTLHAAISDISECKQAEQEHARLQEQLLQSQKLEAIGVLAGGIAHDFNNILTGILGGLSLLEMDLGNSEHQRDIEEMKELVERAANLTQALLGFARRGKNDVRPLDLALAVDKVATMFGRTRKDITIRQEVGHGLYSVLMDRTQLEQVLLNLLINAGQAMPKGGNILVVMTNSDVPVERRHAQGTELGLFVRLVVADAGVGMDATTQSRVFEPFFTTKEMGKGTGLGLASVYGIVKSHGGHIRVESRLGHGTVFTLELRATDMPPRPETMPPVSAVIGNETVLIVDDEDHVRSVCSRVLAKLGYSVLTASGGKDALELVRLHRDAISLVILDMIMPEMSGTETYKALQEITPGIKVLLCSGHSREGQAQEILDGGCNGFIQKPFDVSTLAAKVREAIGAIPKPNQNQ